MSAEHLRLASLAGGRPSLDRSPHLCLACRVLEAFPDLADPFLQAAIADRRVQAWLLNRRHGDGPPSGGP